MRALYRERRRVLLEGLAREFGPLFEPIPSSYGMHVTATTRLDVDLEAATAALRDENVHLHSLARYHAGTPRRAGLVFGYGTVDEAGIVAGLAALRRRLGRAVR